MTSMMIVRVMSFIDWSTFLMTMSKIDDDYMDNLASMAGMRGRKLKTLFIDMGPGFNNDADIDGDYDNDEDDDENFVA